MIGRYAAENGPTRASKHFLKLLRKNISESTTRRFKKEYLLKLKELLKEKPEEKLSMASGTAVNPVEIKNLPSKHQGRPLQLGKELDQAIQEYIKNLESCRCKPVPTGQWTMNKPKAKRVVIANSDDKWQITAVFAATMTDEYLPVQLIYKGTTSRCHPKVVFPEAWDIFHSKNHWSNEVTMRKYIQNIIVPFVNNKQLLKLKKSHPALAIIDCFQGQTTSGILDLLQENNIITVIVPPNCTDKLQPIDLSISKPVKDQMRGKFQEWYASEVQK